MCCERFESIRVGPLRWLAVCRRSLNHHKGRLSLLMLLQSTKVTQILKAVAVLFE